jgi:hypothetical protein
MFAAVSAHTDCLIQIVKERCNIRCCGSEILLNRKIKSSLNYQGLNSTTEQVFCVSAYPVDGAHYREIDLVGKGF